MFNKKYTIHAFAKTEKKATASLEKQIKDVNNSLSKAKLHLLPTYVANYSIQTSVKDSSVVDVHPSANYASVESFADAQSKATHGYDTHAFKVDEFRAKQTYYITKKQLKAIEAKGSVKSPSPSFNFDKKSNGSTRKLY